MGSGDDRPLDEDTSPTRLFLVSEQVGRDLRFAVRSLRKAKTFSGFALLTIALTVGGMTTVFTIVNSVILRPLPYPDAGRLVRVEETNPGEGIAAIDRSVAADDFADIRRESRSFDLMAAFGGGREYTFGTDTEPDRVRVRFVTPEAFSLLGVRMFLGSVTEERAPGLTEAVVSYDFWRDRLEGSPAAVGSIVQPSRGPAFTVVGVTERTSALAGSYDPMAAGIWSLLDPTDEPGRDMQSGWNVIARLREDVPIDTARAELTGISERLSLEFPETNTGRRIHVTPLLDGVLGEAKQQVWIFFGAVALVLLIGIVNLAGLQIVRNAARETEFHVRAALGAGHLRIIGQLLVEAALLGLTGGLLGLVGATAGVRLIVASLPVNFPRAAEIGLDSGILLFAIVVSLLTAILFALLPAWEASRPGIMSVIKSGSPSVAGDFRRARVQRSLLGIQSAFAVVLLVGAALLLHSFWLVFSRDAGMNELDLRSLEVDVSAIYDRTGPAGFWESLLGDVQDLSQVEAAAFVFGPAPLAGRAGGTSGVFPQGQRGDPYASPILSQRFVTPGYFATLGVRLSRGREFREDDTPRSEWVAILNETAARGLWPDGEDPVGQVLTGLGPPTRVVGLVPDLLSDGLADEVHPQVYMPLGVGSVISGFRNRATLMFRTTPEASGLAEAVGTVIHSHEPEAELKQVVSMNRIRWQQVAPERFRTGILLSFALTAMFLVMVGVFGVVAYSGVQRRREIGLRMALGALPADIRRMMMSQVVVPVVAGLIAGLALSLALTRLLESLLFGITPTDPSTLAAAFLVFLVAAFVASLLPARRAARIYPMEALRYE